MKTSVKIFYPEGDESLDLNVRELSSTTRLAWTDGADGVYGCHIVLEGASGDAPTLALYPSDAASDPAAGPLASTKIHLPADRELTVGWLKKSIYFKAMCEQMKMLTQERRANAAPQSVSAVSSVGSGTKLAKWALGISIFALVCSLISGVLSFYSIQAGLGAFAMQAAQRVMMTTPGAEPARTPSHAANSLLRLDDETLGPAGLALLQEAATHSGISMNEKGQLVIMFTDPLCPACQQFESWIAKDGYKTFSPLMVPVAFREGSREVAAAVVCSKNRHKDWVEAVAGRLKVRPGEVCQEGLKVIDRNNEIFNQLGFTGTPTFVSINGRFITGSKSPGEMFKWSEANAN